MITSTLKRTSSIAFFPEEMVAQTPTASPSQQSQQLTNAIIRKSTLPSRSPSLRRAATRSQLRRTRTLDSFERPQASTGYMSPRPLKRQRTEPSESISPDDWQMIPAGDGEATTSSFPATGTTPQQSADLLLSSSLFSATYRFLSSIVSTRSPPLAPPSVNLPHLAQPSEAPVVAGLETIDEMDILEEDIVMVNGEEEIFPPSPIPEYTAEEWSRLSRYPNLVERVMSSREVGIRGQHQQFVACDYAKHANYHLHPPKPRKTSPLAPVKQQREPHSSNKTARPFATDRAVRSAQRHASPSRLRNYPTCSDKYPGPDRSGSIQRNTVLLNFGDWLRASNLWGSVQVTGIQSAKEWYETHGSDEEGTVTPDLNSPTVTNLEGLTEAHFR